MDPNIIIVFIILLSAIVMFSTEKIRNDFAAIIIMVALAWSGALSIKETFSGFSSNAVISIMGVMIIGYGIERTGVMDKLADFVIKKVGRKENRIIGAVSITVGLISSFLQNIGAVALFLPAAKKLSSESGVSPQRIIMPLGFAGILGGTLTMVASGPLIVLNDLLKEGGHKAFGLFDVTPLGIGLLLTGVVYFYFFSGKILPGQGKDKEYMEDELIDIYNLPNKLYEIEIPKENDLVGSSIEELDIWKEYGINILGLFDSGEITYMPWRKTRFNENQTVVAFGEKKKVDKFFQVFNLEAKKRLDIFKMLEDQKLAGFAEIILPPDSSLIGKTLEKIAFRKNYSIEPIAYIDPQGKSSRLHEGEMKAGMKIIVFGRWEELKLIKDSRDFVVITEVSSNEEDKRLDKKNYALAILGLSILLVLLGFPLPLSFFTGAIFMVITGVILIDEIYKAIDWKTVYLLAGLIPLGLAFEKSGAAKLTAEFIIELMGSWPSLFVIGAIGLISAFFSLFMSNVAATVLLVPLILIMSDNFGLDPKGMALLVAVSSANSFIIPTHQVNAYIMGPGNYKSSDFLKFGSILSILFLLVTTIVVYVFYI